MNYRRLYLENSLVFITIVTNKRIPLLLPNADFLYKSLFSVLKFYKFRLIAYSILPEHIHVIIKPKTIYCYPKIIKSFKYSFTKNVGLVNPTYDKIWQTRYWEHTIRDEDDLKTHLDYIHYNPVKHGLVDSVRSWQYSSFHKFVKRGLYEHNWGNSKDIENIKNLNFE